MLRNKLIRYDGSVIDSSVILSCEYSEAVNSGSNLTVGDVTSSEISVEVLSSVAVEQGEMLTYYIIEDDVETLIGQFKVDRPTFASRTTIKFSAYDNIAKAETLFSDWLAMNKGLFPMSLRDLVLHACDCCGLTFATTDFPHADLSVRAFTGDNITCRQILGWAAAIAGRYVKASPNGEIEFAWYSEMDAFICGPPTYVGNLEIIDDGEGNISINCPEMTVSDDGEGNVTVDIPGVTIVYDDGRVSIISDKSISYFLDGVSYESYSTDKIAKVRIPHPESEVAISYPSDADGNCFTLNENAILNACGAGDVLAVAASLYNQLNSISYVPAKLRVPSTVKIRAGDVIRFYTPAPEGKTGKLLQTYVMRLSISASGTSIESSGDKSYGVSQAYSAVSTMSMRETNASGLIRIEGDFELSDYSVLYMGLSASESDPVCCVAMPAEEMTFRVADGSIWTLSPTGLTGNGDIRYIYGIKS